ncbi:E3 ubiquitin-protein ligase RAD18 isoform X2 [Xenopus laevis]|uniref:RING-type E3 ubiquitin transferase n=1 Tax=Xenopus laevis TaxID=8355 RepID=A0A8J1MY74_XENLA|nr:E3 ubiquitin-protein ligase RAD18 isoform X2 [Xenopus laevis]
MATTPEPVSKAKGKQPVEDLDDLLRCAICFDYFNIAVIIPQCSHNYCSLCIRKFLSYKTQCPTCCVAVAEPDLRNNRILDDLVKTFISAREHLSKIVLDSPPMSPQSNPSTSKLTIAKMQGCGGKQVKQENILMDRFLVKGNSSTTRTNANTLQDETFLSQDSSYTSANISNIELAGQADSLLMDGLGTVSPSTSSPAAPSSASKVKVDCPVCGVSIPEQYINKHLDSCLNREEKKDSLRSSVGRRKSMAKIVYNLLSERDLRKKLKEIGLSTRGSKQQMIRRHQEFVHMYNAQCDSLDPKSALEIVREIESNEKTRSLLEANQEEIGMTFKKEQTEEQIDEIHQQYRAKHKNEFQQLVDQVKGRWKRLNKKVKSEPEDGQSSAENDQQQEHVALNSAHSQEHNRLQEQDNPLVQTDNLIVYNNSEFTEFPGSPQSAVSSSSDILRDIDEAVTSEDSSSSLDASGPQKRKRKLSRPKTSSGEIKPRSKRHRK